MTKVRITEHSMTLDEFREMTKDVRGDAIMKSYNNVCDEGDFINVRFYVDDDWLDCEPNEAKVIILEST